MKPLILDYAIERTGTYKPSFEYDSALSMNVVFTLNGKIPFVDLENENLAFVTKTKVNGESDDEGYSLLELQTKTRVLQESDDNSACLLELTTKTLVRSESDD